MAYPHVGFKKLLLIGENTPNDLANQEDLNNIDTKTAPWFGFLTYNMKENLHGLPSQQPCFINMPKMQFVKAAHWIEFGDGTATIHSHRPGQLFEQIMNNAPTQPGKIPTVNFIPDTSKDEYLRVVEGIKDKIVEGDFYELNYCIGFHSANTTIDPIATYWALNKKSPMPFSCISRMGPKWLISASPERFLKKEGNKLVSQPIKGTIRRGISSLEDGQLKQLLQNSEKERAENMMIVDLVRNDLTKVAMPGTIKVDEMFGVYTFQQLHQMISTVSCKLQEGMGLPDIIKATFPMGSMTGAPKIRVMKEIEAIEKTARGLYSGTMGYILPNGDFDFNVVIRSLIYDEEDNKLSYHVGSAITYDSVALQEYEECILKAKAIQETFTT